LECETPQQVMDREPQGSQPGIDKGSVADERRAREYAAYPGGHAEGYPDTFVQLFKDCYGYLAAKNPEAQPSFPSFETGHYEVAFV
jgi:hypothetical protein